MLVTNLEEMELIVHNRGDLEWNGWDVVKYTNDNNAMYSTEGVYHRGKWMKKKTFPLTEDGWYLPNTIGRVDVQVEG